MPVARFFKTLFVPSLNGQRHLWRTDILPVATKVDEVVQLGNLIGCSELVKDGEMFGPNLTTLNYTLLWRATFENWKQLIGPNEVFALNFPDEWTNRECLRLLRKRWLTQEPVEGSFQVAVANKSRLATHGGLTFGEWVNIGRPATAEEAAERLNEKYFGTLYQGGCYRLEGTPNFSANPIFADPLWEVYPSWLTCGEAVPFGQIFGARGINSADGRESLHETFSFYQFAEKVSFTNFGSIVSIGGKPFYNVYPDIEQVKGMKRLPDPWRLLVEKIPVVDLRDELFEQNTGGG